MIAIDRLRRPFFHDETFDDLMGLLLHYATDVIVLDDLGDLPANQIAGTTAGAAGV
jgi:hypothetical protein